MKINKVKTFGVVSILATLAVTPLLAQTPPEQPDPMILSIQDGARHVRYLFTTAAQQMSEEDYAFKPTPEVRNFGQILAHVAESSYWFCSTAMGEEAPVSDIENTITTKADIQQVLAESLDYCDRAYAAMTDEVRAKTMRDVMGNLRPASAVLNFRIYHSMLHWGNAITYMRLRGKVPPSN